VPLLRFLRNLYFLIGYCANDYKGRFPVDRRASPHARARAPDRKFSCEIHRNVRQRASEFAVRLDRASSRFHSRDRYLRGTPLTFSIAAALRRCTASSRGEPASRALLRCLKRSLLPSPLPALVPERKSTPTLRERDDRPTLLVATIIII